MAPPATALLAEVVLAPAPTRERGHTTPWYTGPTLRANITAQAACQGASGPLAPGCRPGTALSMVNATGSGLPVGVAGPGSPPGSTIPRGRR